MLPRLWAFAFRISRNKYDAEELVQRACVRGLERAHQLLPDTSPLHWMFAVIHSIWLNELRSRKIRGRRCVDWDSELLESVADSNSPDPEGNVSMYQIIDAVQRLPESQRTVLVLVAVEGLSYREAAVVLSVPIGTIMSRLSRARKTLGAALRPITSGQ
jgi:RNA polymerase sigma-70 factor (ECF subfamily)